MALGTAASNPEARSMVGMQRVQGGTLLFCQERRPGALAPRLLRFSRGNEAALLASRAAYGDAKRRDRDLSPRAQCRGEASFGLHWRASRRALVEGFRSISIWSCAHVPT